MKYSVIFSFNFDRRLQGIWTITMKNKTFDLFLSVVFIIRNRADSLEEVLRCACQQLERQVIDFELIIIDNASDDKSVKLLKQLTGQEGLPNLQVYALTQQVNQDTAAWVGLENALGDYVAVVDPFSDDMHFLPDLLEKAATGSDVVFARNTHKSPQKVYFRILYAFLNFLFKTFTTINLTKQAPGYRVLSRAVIHYIMQHAQPSITYRYLPAVAGFTKSYLTYCSPVKELPAKKLTDSIDRGMRLLVSTTYRPMRLVTTLSLFGAGINLIYSCYVVLIALFKSDVAPGWISLSLQQSGMFFLISLVLLILGEYILQMVSLNTGGAPYHIAQEFTSARIKRREKLNIEIVSDK